MFDLWIKVKWEVVLTSGLQLSSNKEKKKKGPHSKKKKKKKIHAFMGFKHVPARFLLAACNLTLVLNQMFVDPCVNWCITFYLFLFSYRLFGLVGIIYTDCSAPLALHVRPYLDWPQCASPGVILALYWLLATETRYYFIHVSDIVFVCEMSF